MGTSLDPAGRSEDLLVARELLQLMLRSWSVMHSRRPRPLWRTPPAPHSLLPVSPPLPPLSPLPAPDRGSEDSSPRGTCSSNSTATTIIMTTRLMNLVMGSISIRHKNRKHKTYVEQSLALG